MVAQILSLAWALNGVLLVVAQATGGGDHPELTVTGLVVQLGLSGVFLFQWRAADRERRETAMMALSSAMTMAPVLQRCSETLGEVQRSMAAQVDRVARLPQQAETRLERLIGDLTDVIERNQQEEGGRAPPKRPRPSRDDPGREAGRRPDHGGG